MLYIYSLQISPNAEAIDGGSRKADMLDPYPSLILRIPDSHTTRQFHPAQLSLPPMYELRISLTCSPATYPGLPKADACAKSSDSSATIEPLNRIMASNVAGKTCCTCPYVSSSNEATDRTTKTTNQSLDVAPDSRSMIRFASTISPRHRATFLLAHSRPS